MTTPSAGSRPYIERHGTTPYDSRYEAGFPQSVCSQSAQELETESSGMGGRRTRRESIRPTGEEWVWIELFRVEVWGRGSTRVRPMRAWRFSERDPAGDEKDACSTYSMQVPYIEGISGSGAAPMGLAGLPMCRPSRAGMNGTVPCCHLTAQLITPGRGPVQMSLSSRPCFQRPASCPLSIQTAP